MIPLASFISVVIIGLSSARFTNSFIKFYFPIDMIGF